MKKIKFQLVTIIVTATLLVGCAGTPVLLGTRVDGPIPAGQSRTISSEACGFQLLLFIPININSRAQRAYQAIELEARGDFITNVQVKERWTYGFVGTQYCTEIRATAIHSPVKTTQPSESSKVISSSETAPQKIRELESLRKEGIITEDEFKRSKQMLLDKF